MAIRVNVHGSPEEVLSKYPASFRDVIVQMVLAKNIKDISIVASTNLGLEPDKKPTDDGK